jgi:undecaprenyl-diphosphatase
VVAGGVLGVLLKDVVGRTRPHLPDPVSHAPGASFPSGHALTATLGCGILLLALLPLLGRFALMWAAVAAAVVGVTAYTRVALGVHWLSDVIGGIVLGVAVLMATTAAFETWRTRDKGRPSVSPVREGVEPEAVEAGHADRDL